MDSDFSGQLAYASADFNDFKADGIELGRGKLSCF